MTLTKPQKNSNFMDGNVSLILLKCWLDFRAQNYFNHLANVLASHEKQKTNN